MSSIHPTVDSIVLLHYELYILIIMLWKVVLLLVGLTITSSVGFDLIRLIRDRAKTYVKSRAKSGTNSKLTESLERVLKGEITFSSLIDTDTSSRRGDVIDPKIAKTLAEAKSLFKKIDDFVQDPSVPQSFKVRQFCRLKALLNHFIM